MGYDPHEMWQEIARENEFLEGLGIQVPGAPGFIQTEPEGGENSNEKND